MKDHKSRRTGDCNEVLGWAFWLASRSIPALAESGRSVRSHVSRQDAKTQRGSPCSSGLFALLNPPEKEDRSLAGGFSAQSLGDSRLHSIGLPNGFVCVPMRPLHLDQAVGFPFATWRLRATTRPLHPQRSESELLTTLLGVWYHLGRVSQDRTTRCTQALGRMR